MALLGARNVTELEVTLAPVGGLIGYCKLDSGAMPAPGVSTLTIGDLVLAVTVLPNRGGIDSPAHPSIALASGYGWRTRLPAPGGSFSSPGGVRLSTVLAALSALSGEAVDITTPDAKIGPAYGWDAGTRGRVVLADLVARGAVPTWRVDPRTSRTTFTPWPTLPAADARGVIVGRSLAHGIRHVKLASSVAAWLPGASAEGARIARVTFREKDSETSADVAEA